MIRKESGFSLISVMAAMVVIALLLNAGYRYQKQVKEQNRAGELVSVITNLKKEVQSIRGVESDVEYFEKLEASGSTPPGFEPLLNKRRWNTKWGRVYVGGMAPWLSWAPPGFGNADGVIFAFPAVSNEICFKVIQTIEPQFDFIMYVSDEEYIIKNYDTQYQTSAALKACGGDEYGEVGILRLMVYG